MADGNDETIDDPVLKPLTAQLAVLTKRAEIEEQRIKLLNLGITADKLPSGAYDISGEAPPIEGIILAHETVTALAEGIAERVAKKGVKRVRIQNAADAKLLSGLAVLNVQLATMESEVDTALNMARSVLGDTTAVESLALSPIVGALLNSTVQLAGLFRADRTIANSKIELNPRALVTALAGALMSKNITVFEGVGLPRVSQESPPDGSIASRLLKLGALRQQLAATAVAIAEKTADAEAVVPDLPVVPRPDVPSNIGTSTNNLVDTAAPAPEPPQGPTKSTAQESKRQTLAAARTTALATVARVDALVDALTKIDTTTGSPPLGEAFVAERLASFINMADTHILTCEAQVGGASQVTKWFFKSTLTFSGGAVVSFTLTDHGGELTDAATLTLHSGFVGLEAVQGGNIQLRTAVVSP